MYNTNQNIPVRFFVIDYDLDPVDFDEVDAFEFEQAEGNITMERHTVRENGINQICFYKGRRHCQPLEKPWWLATLRYAAKHKPVTIHARVLKPTNEGSMYVLFSDGATCRANFASYRVMDHFIAMRSSWHESGVKITTNE